jgi:hypothetical protein
MARNYRQGCAELMQNSVAATAFYRLTPPFGKAGPRKKCRRRGYRRIGVRIPCGRVATALYRLIPPCTAFLKGPDTLKRGHHTLSVFGLLPLLGFLGRRCSSNALPRWQEIIFTTRGCRMPGVGRRSAKNNGTSPQVSLCWADWFVPEYPRVSVKWRMPGVPRNAQGTGNKRIA